MEQPATFAGETIERLEELAKKADEHKVEFTQRGDARTAQYYLGMYDAYRRAITLVSQGI